MTEFQDRDGFHLEPEAPRQFVSGFTRWIEENALEPVSEAFLDLTGHQARTEGLDPDDLADVARLTGTTPEEVERVYRRDNTEWAADQATLDASGLADLDEHLDAIDPGL
ncbi:hypothetical protein [Streptomyces sp. Da 82-17]|uniref:hypothetical protein n=1 Tax=Streptomyces sp. Da 82-17 TaxID=3377116 RepID=UPI0038D4C68F